jgi:Tfp pilus assembly protein PilO
MRFLNFSLGNVTKKEYRPKDFAKKRYLSDLKILAPMKEEKARQYGMLVFTLLMLSFFGLFAINPTIGTIVELRRKLADSEMVNAQLENKLQAMSSLQQQYATIQPDLPSIYAAIPEEPETARLLGQIQQIAKQSNVSIVDLSSLPVTIKADPKVPKKPNGMKENAVAFSIEAVGSYENLQEFLTILDSFDRLLSITEVTITTEGAIDQSTRTLFVEGKGYYQHGS